MIIVQLIGRLIHILKDNALGVLNVLSITIGKKKQQIRLKLLTNEFFFVFLQQIFNESK